MRYKFRGRNRNGEYIYGDYLTKMYFRELGRPCDGIFVKSDRVEPVTDVAILIGYDDDGKEVYSDDKILDAYGNDVYAAVYFPVKLNGKLIER